MEPFPEQCETSSETVLVSSKQSPTKIATSVLSNKHISSRTTTLKSSVAATNKSEKESITKTNSTSNMNKVGEGVTKDVINAKKENKLKTCNHRLPKGNTSCAKCKGAAKVSDNLRKKLPPRSTIAKRQRSMTRAAKRHAVVVSATRSASKIQKHKKAIKKEDGDEDIEDDEDEIDEDEADDNEDEDFHIEEEEEDSDITQDEDDNDQDTSDDSDNDHHKQSSSCDEVEDEDEDSYSGTRTIADLIKCGNRRAAVRNTQIDETSSPATTKLKKSVVKVSLLSYHIMCRLACLASYI